MHFGYGADMVRSKLYDVHNVCVRNVCVIAGYLYMIVLIFISPGPLYMVVLCSVFMPCFYSMIFDYFFH